MNPLYNLAISFYKSAVKAVSKRNIKAAKLIAGQNATFGILEKNIDNSTGGYIWIHASSLGEFEQGRPLIEMLKRKMPSQKILLTFFSSSGYEVRKDYKGVDVICYLPFDTPDNVRRFMDIVKPQMSILVKYEFWGNYLHALKDRGVPTYIISSIFRPRQTFFKPWGGMFRGMLECFTHIFVQDEESKRLLATIGITNTTVAGDTRFDRVTDILSGCRSFPIVEKFVSNSEFTMIIGSSWEPDEDIIIPYFNSHLEMKLIIAPHEFSPARLKSLVSRITRPVELYSNATEDNAPAAECLVLDCFGILSSCYRYAQVAYIGGGFGSGIHNLNEAAVYGIPVVFGPNYHKFKEAYELIACEGGYSIDGDTDFKALMTRFIADADFLAAHGEKAGRYIESKLGATEKIYSAIFNE